jgi:hypothetical protein
MGSSINARAASSLSGFMPGASTASQASSDAGLLAFASFDVSASAGTRVSGCSLSLLPLLSAPLLGGLLLLRPART